MKWRRIVVALSIVAACWWATQWAIAFMREIENAYSPGEVVVFDGPTGIQDTASTLIEELRVRNIDFSQCSPDQILKVSTAMRASVCVEFVNCSDLYIPIDYFDWTALGPQSVRFVDSNYGADSTNLVPLKAEFCGSVEIVWSAGYRGNLSSVKSNSRAFALLFSGWELSAAVGPWVDCGVEQEITASYRGTKPVTWLPSEEVKSPSPSARTESVQPLYAENTDMRMYRFNLLRNFDGVLEVNLTKCQLGPNTFWTRGSEPSEIRVIYGAELSGLSEKYAQTVGDESGYRCQLWLE